MGGDNEVFHLLEDYDYPLPPSLIAQAPLAERQKSRLLVLRRDQQTLEHKAFEHLGSFLGPGDVLVLNDSRVVPARLRGTKETGGKVELLVLEPFRHLGERGGNVYDCLLKASKPCRPPCLVTLRDGIRAEILTNPEEGKAQVRFLTEEPLGALLERLGEVPLPPYIHRDETASHFQGDSISYQTVYAREPGSVAAPTAGLHFTDQLLTQLQAQGVEVVTITLHVGYGTFAPMRVGDIRNHRMHPEYAEITAPSAQCIARAKSKGRRVVAVGTTSARILEWVARERNAITDFAGNCDLFIYPGYRFQAVDALITNFHLPKSTLLLLVSAFAGRTAILDAYREAIRQQYRFFSYGDAMLIL